MTWTTPVNLATGDKVTDAIYNLQIIDNLAHLYTPRYALIQDQKASGTAGGGFTNGAWRTRDLNTVVSDIDNICSLLANQITLGAGIYRTHWVSLGHNVGIHQGRLQNITAGTTLVLGTNTRCQAGTATDSMAIGFGLFTLAVTSVLEVQHRCGVTVAIDGFGTAGAWGTEVYSTIELWKLT